jgi:8-oxo-dGTP pyrophosphatase MutT (NUDIX family)
VAFIDHIRRCNAWDPADYTSWTIGGRIAGYVRHALRPRLASFAGLFVDDDGLRLDPRHATPQARSAALAETARRLHEAGIVHYVTGERFPVLVEDEPVAALERGAVAVLGVESYGVHVNGVVRRADGPHLWISRRANTRVYPNQLDNFVAGGLPHDHTIEETLIKECAEEAGLDAALARRATPIGAISYVMATEAGMGGDGLNRHALYCYDLDLPPEFVPRPVDGESAGFSLLPVAEVARIVEGGFDFKFNCALVIIDFLIRHGLLGPSHPDYLALCRGLRR